MENIFDNKWDILNKQVDNGVEYTGNQNVDRSSSGSRWQDELLGLGVGLYDAMPSGSPGSYFVDTNYVGNGLAKSSGNTGGIGYMKNNRYRDPYDLLNYWQSKLRQNKYGDRESKSLSTRLGDVFEPRILGNIGTIDVIPQYQYPTSINDTSNWYVPSNTINAYREPKISDYLNTGKYSNFRNKIADYFDDNYFNTYGGI